MRAPRFSIKFALALAAVAALAIVLARTLPAAHEVPRVWDEAALERWATPLAALNERPTHMSASEYYAIPEEMLRTYSVYMPGREPAGYWDRLIAAGPQPLVALDRLETEADWIEAGRTVFFDSIVLRTFDADVIAKARNGPALEALRTGPLPDGSINGLRWVPTKDGVALGFTNCSACHLLYLPDNTPVPGASSFAMPNNFRNGIGGAIRAAERTLPGETPFSFGGPIGAAAYQAYAAPWIDPEGAERLRNLTEPEFDAWIAAGIRGGGVARFNGSIFYPAKIPDLIGIKDRKYIDHTGTHLHRDAGDFMRYAALVSSAEAVDFAGQRMITADTQRFQTRLPDAALYALALYVYSLQPPPNPHPFDERAAAGQELFARERCGRCHTPPLYTNNKLTLAEGFMPPENATEDILRVSVGTDTGLALRTRKGTGYYKVPSLRGVWYRGHYLHDGAAASLEELFDAGRLEDGHVRGGFLPVGAKSGAIRGHEYGLDLEPEERAQLIAFLRTL